MKRPHNASLPVGFIFLCLLTVTLLVLALLRIAAYSRKNKTPKNAAEQDLYPWATEAMRAAYDDTQTLASKASASERETVTQSDLENIVTQESQLRQSGQQAYNLMSADTQKYTSDYETDQDFYRQMKYIP